MAQLIKLRDYISRYEINPFHYPTQFIRLKKENWEKLVQMWEAENEREAVAIYTQEHEAEQQAKFRWNPFAKKTTNEDVEMKFGRTLPYSREQLVRYFLNQLYPFQLKWATSTITHVSFTDQSYYGDTNLKFFLQSFPDIYLLMYYPIFNIKKAPVDGEIIFISPIGIEVISLIDEGEDATIYVSDDRTWEVESPQGTKRILSPMISLKRTEQIIKSILKRYDIPLNIEKTILSQTNHFLYHTEPYKTKIIGKNNYHLWKEDKRRLNASLKGVQLKATEALLKHCVSTAVRRPEWENDEAESMITFINNED